MNKKNLLYLITLVAIVSLSTASYAQFDDEEGDSADEQAYWPPECCYKVPQPAQFCTVILLNDEYDYITDMVNCPDCKRDCPEECPDCKRFCPDVGYIQCGNKDCHDCPCPPP